MVSMSKDAVSKDAMSKEMEAEIFGLMTAAQDQQAAVQAALARLEAQEAALQEERRALAKVMATLREDGAAMRRAADEIGPRLQGSTDKAVRGAVAGSLAEAGQMAAQALASSVRPSLDRLEAVVASAQAVEPALRRAVGWLTWPLLARLGTVAVVLVVVSGAARAGLGWWTDYSLSLARAKKALLEAEIVGLENTRDTLERAGAKAGITRCGTSARLCIRVDEGAGPFGNPADYRVIRGY